jgi:hypothetical protein
MSADHGPIRILVVDDHPLLREGIAALVGGQADMTLVAEGANGRVFSDAPGGRSVPFFLMPSLGGHNTLRGYYDYRFHDNDMQAFNAESRWALFDHLVRPSSSTRARLRHRLPISISVI